MFLRTAFRVATLVGVMGVCAPVAAQGSPEDTQGAAADQAGAQASEEGQLQAEALDDKSAQDMERAARALFQAGSVAFDQGRYDDALRHFTEAYKLAPDRHLLLYNIASSYDRLRQDREALDYFKRYLEAERDPVNRPAVTARVQLLEEAVARAEKAEEERLAAEEARRRAAEAAAAAEAERQQAGPEDERGMRKLSPLYTYILGGVGVAALGAGVGVFMIAKKEHDTYTSLQGANPSDANFQQAQDAKDKGEMLNTVSIAMLGVGGACAVAAGVIGGVFTDWKGKGDAAADERPAASVWFGPEGAGVRYRHAF